MDVNEAFESLIGPSIYEYFPREELITAVKKGIDKLLVRRYKMQDGG